MSMFAAITIQTKLFRVKAAKSQGPSLRMPEWYSFEELPKEFRRLLHKESGCDEDVAKSGGARQKGKAGGSAKKPKAKAASAKKVSPKAKATKKAVQGKAAMKPRAKQQPSARVVSGDLAGPGSQTRLQPVRMPALLDSESPVRKRSCRAAGRGRRELRSLSPGYSGAMQGSDGAAPHAKRDGRQVCPASSQQGPPQSSACSGDVCASPDCSGSEPLPLTGPTGRGGPRGLVPGRKDVENAAKDVGRDVHEDTSKGAPHLERPAAQNCAKSPPQVNDVRRSGDDQSDVDSDAESPGQENRPGHQCQNRHESDMLGAKESLQSPTLGVQPTKRHRAL